MHKHHFGGIITVCLLLLFFLTGCQNNSSRITVVGSSAMQLLAEQAGNDYRLAHPSSNIVVQGGGSGTGLSQIQAGAVQIGTSDVFAETQSGINAKKLKDHLIAVVGIVPIEDIVLKGKKPVAAQEQDSNGTVKKIVASTPGTISYISFPYANDQNIQKLSIDNIQPTNQNITTNKWQLWSYEHMYTKLKPSKATQDFIDYMLGSKVQEDLIPKIDYLSIKDMKVERDSNNQVTKIGN